jgi:uncharacterized membrane protein (DUF441 family)
MKKKSWFFILLVLVVGALIGSTLGEILAYVMPAGVVKQFFLKSFIPTFGPATLDIGILTLTFGISLKINFISIFGIFIAGYLLRWID